MKYLSFVVMATALLLSCNNSGTDNGPSSRSDDAEELAQILDDCFIDKQTLSNYVVIKYTNKVNGFDVVAVLNPFTYVEEWNLLLGNARIFFFGKASRPVEIDHPEFYTYLEDDVAKVESGSLIRCEYVEGYEYDENVFQNPSVSIMELGSGGPFFFLDVNFDDKPDLLLRFRFMAPFGHDGFLAFDSEVFSGDERLLKTLIPISDLDVFSEVDYVKKTLTTYHFTGTNQGEVEELVYRRQPDGSMMISEINVYPNWNDLVGRPIRTLKFNAEIKEP